MRNTPSVTRSTMSKMPLNRWSSGNVSRNITVMFAMMTMTRKMSNTLLGMSLVLLICMMSNSRRFHARYFFLFFILQ